MSEEFEFQKRVTAAMEAGVAMSKRDWAIAAVRHREKNESLRAELAEKDRRIEELQHEVTALQGWLAKGDESVHIITTGQINKAWENNQGLPYFRETMSLMGIVACPKCGGTKWCSYTEYEAQRLGRTTYECDCPNSGWTISRSSAVTTEDSEQCPMCNGTKTELVTKWEDGAIGPECCERHERPCSFCAEDSE